MTYYYKVLGVNAQATDKEIKASYRKLAKQYHPDAAGDDPEKPRKMYVIQEAYDILSDPEKREAYDVRLRGEISGEAFRTAGGAAMGRRGRHEPNVGQTGAPESDMSRFEQFFGFRPGKGMETSRGKNPGPGKPEGPVNPEEMFASFFGKIKR